LPIRAQFLKIVPALVRRSFRNPLQCSLVLTLRRVLADW